MNVPFIDLSAQYAALESDIQSAIQSVLKKTNFILGEPVALFEKEFAAYSESRRAVAVASGLDAIRLALRGLSIGPGDEVITVANTFIATTLAISSVGATPVLVDCDESSFNIDVGQIEAAITPRTRAIIPVHLYGQPADMDEILAIAKRRGLSVIEDACQAHGAKYRGRRAGGLGNAAAFSFYPGKNLGAYGDGGIVTTQDEALADKIGVLRNYGSKVKYFHALMGENSRLDTLQAAVLRVKLAHLDSWNASRRALASRYTQQLAGLAQVKTPVIAPDRESVFHLYVIRVPRRAELMTYLQQQGISTIIHYPVPIHLQEAYAGAGWKKGQFPVAERVADEIVSLPMFAELKEDQVDHVAATIRRFFSQSST